MVRVAALLLVAGIVWAVLWSPLLMVRAVRVVGGRHTTSEDVAAAAGIDSGDNLLFLSTDQVADQVRGLPWVKDADVDRMLPGTIRVRIRERRPAMVLSLPDAQWRIDAHGRVLGVAHSTHGNPVLAGTGGTGLEPGAQVRDPGASDALRVWRELPAPLRSSVEAAFAPTPERITLFLRAGVQVRYGAAERMAAKNRVLGVLLRRTAAQGRAVGYIDVRVPTSPAVAGAAPAEPLNGPAPATSAE
jgi:cell division protein FtsQ